MRTLIQISHALHDSFAKEGFGILEARNGEEGLAIALKEHPEAILLDIVMPKMDGIEMARALRSDPWGSKVPIIILTNAPDIKKVEQAVENQVFEYFIKSDTKLKHIVERVREILE